VTRRLYLHIGLQKTGTSYVQGIWDASAPALAAQGLDLALESRREAYWLMLDVRDRFRPQDPAAARAVLRDLPRRLDRLPGDRALITEESLSPADDAQVRRLLAACGDREVHVLVSARDLARQVPSVWQQEIQSGGHRTFERYLERLRSTEGTDAPIWWQKDLSAVLDRWTRHVSPSRVHVVTVPPSGGPRDLLLRRYCDVLGLDVDSLDLSDVGRGNRGLRLEQAEVMRRVNERIPEGLMRRDLYGNVGKRYLSVQVLGDLDGRRILMPATQRAWCEEAARRQVDHLVESGVDVVGDPEDLLPSPESFADDEQEVTEAQVAEAAVGGLSVILNNGLRAGHRRSPTVPVPRWRRVVRRAGGLLGR